MRSANMYTIHSLCVLVAVAAAASHAQNIAADKQGNLVASVEGKVLQKYYPMIILLCVGGENHPNACSTCAQHAARIRLRCARDIRNPNGARDIHRGDQKLTNKQPPPAPTTPNPTPL